ncbi:MAG: PadR family transcriptional regulator [Candidatus Marinimicrobia bacterium]|nr:PadR family transcriptional regulator [Candidatus Neomarinimicrobiota bacterium]
MEDKQTTISNAEAALMGLLAEKPKHAYLLEKDVEYREMRTWTDLSMSNIYKLLRKLEEKELVKSQTEISDGNRVRKIFDLTEAGREALEIKLRSMLRKPELGKDPFHVGIYNSDLLPEIEVRSCLEQYQEEVLELIDGYGRLEKFLIDSGCSTARLAVAIRPRYQWEGELKWLNEYLEAMNK